MPEGLQRVERCGNRDRLHDRRWRRLQRLNLSGVIFLQQNDAIGEPCHLECLGNGRLRPHDIDVDIGSELLLREDQDAQPGAGDVVEALGQEREPPWPLGDGFVDLGFERGGRTRIELRRTASSSRFPRLSELLR